MLSFPVVIGPLFVHIAESGWFHADCPIASAERVLYRWCNVRHLQKHIPHSLDCSWSRSVSGDDL